MNITLNKLLTFSPENETERNIFTMSTNVLTEYLIDTRSSWSNGYFYLGGFIKMKPDEEITLQKIENVKVIR